MRYQSIRRNRQSDDGNSAASTIYWGMRPQAASNGRVRGNPVKHAENRRGSGHRPEDGHLVRLAGVLVFLALLAVSTAALAELDFELPEADGPGSGFVRLSDLEPKATIINFWRSDCPPCLRELPLLNRYAAEHPEIRVITVALQKRSQTSASPVSPKAPIIALHGPSQPQGVLARFGNRSGALPFTVLLNPGREDCAQKTGEIDEAWIQRRLRACLPDRVS